MELFPKYRGFLIALIPASIGGWIWSMLGLPLGWLMGSAIVTGLISFQNISVTLPKSLYWPALSMIGAGVGLAITPEVASQILRWFPFMATMAFAGVLLAVLFTPYVARQGGMSPATAYFALMPGGVIEMANIGTAYGADRTIIPALHAIRVALVVGILPLGLYLSYPTTGVLITYEWLTLKQLIMVIPVALLGGWIGKLINMPASWLLGSLLAVGIGTMLGLWAGEIPRPLMAVAQIIVGMSLGAKFLRERLAQIPRAIAAGTPVLTLIIVIMAGTAIFAASFLPFDVPSMVLAFSIGGLAEMVLTANALGRDMALVAAFQAIRAILVNSCAGFIWSRLASKFNT